MGQEQESEHLKVSFRLVYIGKPRLLYRLRIRWGAGVGVVPRLRGGDTDATLCSRGFADTADDGAARLFLQSDPPKINPARGRLRRVWTGLRSGTGKQAGRLGFPVERMHKLPPNGSVSLSPSVPISHIFIIYLFHYSIFFNPTM